MMSSDVQRELRQKDNDYDEPDEMNQRVDSKVILIDQQVGGQSNDTERVHERSTHILTHGHHHHHHFIGSRRAHTLN